jgi:hypothetical protein
MFVIFIMGPIEYHEVSLRMQKQNENGNIIVHTDTILSQGVNLQ